MAARVLPGSFVRAELQGGGERAGLLFAHDPESGALVLLSHGKK